jgi:hypothetical protein
MEEPPVRGLSHVRLSGRAALRHEKALLNSSVPPPIVVTMAMTSIPIGAETQVDARPASVVPAMESAVATTPAVVPVAVPPPTPVYLVEQGIGARHGAIGKCGDVTDRRRLSGRPGCSCQPQEHRREGQHR